MKPYIWIMIIWLLSLSACSTDSWTISSDLPQENTKAEAPQDYISNEEQKFIEDLFVE